MNFAKTLTLALAVCPRVSELSCKTVASWQLAASVVRFGGELKLLVELRVEL